MPARSGRPVPAAHPRVSQVSRAAHYLWGATHPACYACGTELVPEWPTQGQTGGRYRNALEVAFTGG